MTDISSQFSREDALESLLRREFARDIEAQGAQLPDPQLIMLMARLSEGARRRPWYEPVRRWSEAIALSTVAGILGLWWADGARGLESLAPAVAAEASWAGQLGLSGGILGASLWWVRLLLRSL